MAFRVRHAAKQQTGAADGPPSHKKARKPHSCKYHAKNDRRREAAKLTDTQLARARKRRYSCARDLVIKLQY